MHSSRPRPWPSRQGGRERTLSGGSLAQRWGTSADAVPATPCLVQGDRTSTRGEVDRRADGVAVRLPGLGVSEQDTVAQHLYDCPEHLESMFASDEAGLVPVHTDHRYADDAELACLWDDADAVAVVLHGESVERVDRLRGQLGTVRGRRQDDLVMRITAQVGRGLPEQPDDARVRAGIDGHGPASLPSCPLLHGTGAPTAQGGLTRAGSVVLLTQRRDDPLELLDTVSRRKATSLAIVGGACAQPLLRALDAEPGRWDVVRLLLVSSSGVRWSEESEQGLLRRRSEETG